MTFMSKLDPKLVHLGEDVPWGVDGAREDLTASKKNVKNVSFVTSKEYGRSKIGPAVQRSSGPAVQVRPTGRWRASSGPYAFNRFPVQG